MIVPPARLLVVEVMFPENPDEIADYRLAVERLTDLTADVRQSVRLLHAIAEELEKVR